MTSLTEHIKISVKKWLIILCHLEDFIKKIRNRVTYLKIPRQNFGKIELKAIDSAFDSNFQRKLVSGIKTSKDVKKLPV